jgi:tRNA dimethylallyltransferase
VSAASSAGAEAICVVGPTASGKSAVALAIAERWRVELGLAVEIVSVDSAQVYRGLDIGTAKPNAAERARVPHHGLDLLDPAERYSAARFVDDARAAIEGICGRGAVPLLVGGTILYLKALIDGLDALPAADLALRAELEMRAARHGWPALHAELARVDPTTAARLAPTDAQRIQRALEVEVLTGRPLSAWHTATAADGDSVRGRRAAWPLVSLEPRDRDWLAARIAVRFEAMLAAGLLDEVRGLMARADLSLALPSMRAVGYRQAWEALQAADGALDATATQALRGAATAATRQLAKRQLTWLRRFPERTVVACDDEGAVEQALAAATAVLPRLRRTGKDLAHAAMDTGRRSAA